MNKLDGYYIEELSEGMSAVYAKTVTEADLVMFAAVSGDMNPLHINEEFASQTIFKGRIAHGIISASFISAAVATKLPGPGSIYLGQTLKFKAPVRIGDTVNVRVTVKQLIPERKRVVLDTVCTVRDTVVVEGEAMVMVESKAR